MWDPLKIRAAVLALGWPKASFCACLVLLFRGVVSFDQCLLLILCGALLHFLPRENTPKTPRRMRAARTRAKVE
jgi:hypothetical protein